MGLTIKNETVYVIYRNGLPYQATGRKLVYTSKGSANGVITSEAKDIAEYEFENADKGHNYWYDLTREKREELIKKEKANFKVVEYSPRVGE